MITIQEYEQAKAVIAAYKKQNAKIQKTKRAKKVFTLSDLDIMNYLIIVQVRKESGEDQTFAGNIESKINDHGFFLEDISIDDRGYMCISFPEIMITEGHANAVLNALNNNRQQ